MPSELFYTINFSFAITASIIGLIFSLLIIFIVILNRQCHTVSNLLICDLCIATIIDFGLCIVGCVYSLGKTWYNYQPLCTLRAYGIMVSVNASIYSFLIQAISRVFFAVFHKHRFLLTWSTHWILITLKWFISVLISIEPFFIENGFQLVQEYRLCGTTTEELSVALYSTIISFIVPVSIIAIIYGIILYQARQLTRRLAPSIVPGLIPVHTSSPSAKRNLKIMQNMVILLSIQMCGGTPYSILILWSIIQHQTVPEELYLLSINLIVYAITISMIVSFFMNKTVKDITFGYF